MDDVINRRYTSGVGGGLEAHALLLTPVYLLPEWVFGELGARQESGGILTNSQLACPQPRECNLTNIYPRSLFTKWKSAGSLMFFSNQRPSGKIGASYRSHWGSVSPQGKGKTCFVWGGKFSAGSSPFWFCLLPAKTRLRLWRGPSVTGRQRYCVNTDHLGAQCTRRSGNKIGLQFL